MSQPQPNRTPEHLREAKQKSMAESLSLSDDEASYKLVQEVNRVAFYLYEILDLIPVDAVPAFEIRASNKAAIETSQDAQDFLNLAQPAVEAAFNYILSDPIEAQENKSSVYELLGPLGRAVASASGVATASNLRHSFEES